MAKKPCPHFSARRDGRWHTVCCSSPKPCHEAGCEANPHFKEPDPDGAEE